MDEIWQRHRTFIVQLVVIALVFVIALAVMSNNFSGPQDDAEQLSMQNRSRKQALDAKVAKSTGLATGALPEAPSAKSIDEQVSKANQAETQMRSMAAQVASLKATDDYVLENLKWIQETIEKSPADAQAWFATYKLIPQSGLSKVREEIRMALVGKAARLGRQIDEGLGVTGAFDEDEVPQAIHGLAIVADVISRALATENLTAVGELRISSGNVMSTDTPWISGIRVHVSLTGHPDAVTTVLRSFNSVDNKMKRMTVIQEVESISRPRREDDAIRAQFHLLGLQFKGARQ